MTIRMRTGGTADFHGLTVVCLEYCRRAEREAKNDEIRKKYGKKIILESSGFIADENLMLLSTF